MRYLYGDSSEFPLNQNFIETAAAATDMAVALLKVDELIARAKKTAEEANDAARGELADLEALAQHVHTSLAQRDHLSKATAKVAEEVAQQAATHFGRARTGVKSWRDATIRKAKQGTGPSAIMEPIHRFVTRHELPYTTWGLRWKAGVGEEPVQAQVYAIMQRGVTATIGIAIPKGHLWSQPVRVSQLEKGLSIQLMGKNWLGRDKMCDELLDKLYVTRVTRTSEREMIVLSRKAKDPSPGLRISLREGDKKRISVVRVDEDDNPVGEMVTLSSINAETVRRLWNQIKRTIGDLIRHRAQLLAATLNGKSILELESPAPVAVAMVQSVAPLVRDMHRHSRTPGELQLKRDLGDGRREELFISHEEIVRKYAHLSATNRKLFDAFGLNGNARVSVPASQPVSVARPSEPMMLAPAPASQPAASQRTQVAERTPRELIEQQKSRLAQHRAERQRAAQERAQDDEQRRLAAVREAADAVRRAASRGSVIPTPPSQPALHSTAPPPALYQSHSGSVPPSSIPVPSQSEFVAAVSVSAVSMPAVPPPPRMPSDARPRVQSDVAPSAPASVVPAPSAPPKKKKASLPPPPPSRGVFRLPPPSAPPPRRKEPALRVVNG